MIACSIGVYSLGMDRQTPMLCIIIIIIASFCFLWAQMKETTIGRNA